MLIYVITEYYPSLYKPYFDTQFAQFLEDGHSVRVFALGGGDGAQLQEKVVRWNLDQLTAHLPGGRRSLPRFVAPVVRHMIAAPRARLSALRRAIRSRPPGVRKAMDAARLLLLPSEPPDICLVHNLLAAREVGFLRELYPGVPIAFYYHGGELTGMPTVPDDEAAAAFNSADVTFTNTARSRAHAIGRGCRPDQIVVCPVGFALEDFPPLPDRTYRSDGVLRLLSVGRLSPEKGFSYAIEAVRQLVEAGERNLRYCIVGGGPLLAALTAQVNDAGLEQVVEIAGPVSRGRLDAEFRQADALVLPSIVVGTWEENQACVVQEAMLMQMPVIATATGGVPESLAPELHPFLAPEGDATALAQRIREVAALTTEQLAELGRAGRRFSEARYDIRDLNHQLLSETLARGPRTPAADR